MLTIEIILGKIIIFIGGLINKNKGTNISGKIMLSIDKKIIKRFKDIDYNKVIVVTGTNGKSTTTNLLSHIFKYNNKKVISNLEGANLISGIATILIKGCNLKGSFKDAYFILEIDERNLKTFFQNIPAKNLIITNIQKDQVCRNGDPDYIYRKIEAVITKDMTLYLNNHDPRSKALEGKAKKVIYYGVNKNKESYKDNCKIPVTMPCPICSSKINFNYYNVANIGEFSCSNCKHKSEENIKYNIKKVNYKENYFEILDDKIHMPYVANFMLYNYAVSYALAKEFKLDNIKESFKTFENIKGRMETLIYNKKQIKYIRIKQENPETLQSALDLVSKDLEEKVVIIGFCLLKDFKPYYSNTFYSYDCDFSSLVKSNVEKYICFSKTVSYDTANRIIYEDVDKKKIKIINNDNVEEIMSEINKCKSDNIYLITWIKTYEDIEKYLESVN